MTDETNGYLGFGIFFLIIAAIVAFGSFILYKDSRKTNDGELSNNSNTYINELDTIKVDQSEDIIYFDNEMIISSKLGISYKDVVINIDSDDAKKINDLLKKEKEELVNRIIKKEDAPADNTCDFDESDNIYEIRIRDYAIFKNNGYVILIINDSSYNCESSFGIIDGLASYVFDIKTGKILNEDNLLKKYNLTIENIEEKIRAHLKNKQNEVTNENGLIKIEETIENMKYNENYLLYINESEELELKYIVKTSTVDYNDSIILS